MLAPVPAHRVGEETVNVITGLGLTGKFNVLVVRQPKALLPVTEYKVVAVGFAITEDEMMPPGFHVYEVAPAAVSVAEAAGQTEAEVLVKVRVGPLFTVTPTVALLLQPASNPRTV
jgi:hypothetical protein